MGSCLSSRATAQSMSTVNWSELPMELVNLISQFFDNEVDLIRFRSVCSHWRSSSIINNKDNTFFCGYLSKQSVFLIKPQQQLAKTRPWLIGISQNSSGQNKLYHPLPPYHRISFPHVFDFNKVSILHLRTEFRSDFMDYNHTSKAVAVTCQGKKKTLVLGMLSSTPHSPHSLLLKCGNENWKVIPGMSIKSEDVCRFKRRLYTVDKTGQTVAVGPDDSTVQLVAKSLVGGGDVKFLVESKGDLLLVDVYDCTRIGFPGHNPVRIHLFKLNEKETEWVKLKSLGDIVLFLGADCSFSASASDLSVAKGNCVIFLKNVFPSFQHFGFVHRPRALTSTTTGCILDLDKHHLSPLSDYPEYFNLFPQPPEWIVKSCIRN